MPNIKLKSCDGKVFDVDSDIASLMSSSIISPLLENLSLNDGKGKDIDPILLPKVNSAILEKIITWATHHKDDERASQKNWEDGISSWDADFVNVDHGTLNELILAAHYLDIKELLELTCKTRLKYFQNLQTDIAERYESNKVAQLHQ